MTALGPTRFLTRILAALTAAALTMPICPPATARASEIVVDASTVTGTVRPLHGVNNGPLNFGEMIDVSDYYRSLNIPLARLHDSGWPNPDIVDIHAIFPDLRADANDPRSYRFSRTDDYIKPIIDSGIGIVYRLGESIEHTRKKYRVIPPADYDAWANVCIGIIRHYNECWADGFEHNIRYWEIWNEPENRPAMWTGTDDDYYRLYATAAKKIKDRWPTLKVGGPSAGYQGSFIDDRLEPSPFLKGFLEYCRDNNLPLDFFSWHTYTNDPCLSAKKARAIRRLLDDYGFTKTQSHLNEWNYLPDDQWKMTPDYGIERKQWFDRITGAEGAAFLLCTLIDLQTAPVDVANYYGGDTSWFGLFDSYGIPNKTFYAMQAFRMLLDTPLRVKASGGIDGQLAVCAGLNEDRTQMTILLANLRADDDRVQLRIEGLPWKDRAQLQIHTLDAAHNLEPTGPAVGDLLCPAPSILVIRLHKPLDAK